MLTNRHTNRQTERTDDPCAFFDSYYGKIAFCIIEVICLLDFSERSVQEQQNDGIDDKDPSLCELLLDKEKHGTEESTGRPCSSHIYVEN